MRVLVIGYGSAGKRHAHNARELGHEVVVREHDHGKREQALDDGFVVQHLGFTWRAEWGEGYSNKGAPPDAAIIATPAHTHYEVAHSLRSEGYEGPLFVEKPLDTSTEHADFWRSWPHPTVMVGYNWRFVEGVREARGAERVFARTWTDMSQWPGADYAGPLLECSHDIDLTRWLTGQRPVVVRRHDDFWVARCEAGPLAELVMHPHPWRELIADGQRVYDLLHDHEITQAVEPSYKAELAAFLKAADNGTGVDDGATFEDGLAVVEICEQAMGAK